jgi:hypothetical protein
MDDLGQRYHLDLVTAFVRGRLPQTGHLAPHEAFEAGQRAGLRLHTFKRTTMLPRVRLVLGMLRGLAPDSLVDVGSGRGTFLWPPPPSLTQPSEPPSDRGHDPWHLTPAVHLDEVRTRLCGDRRRLVGSELQW